MVFLTNEVGPIGYPYKNKFQPPSHTLHKNQFERDGSNYNYKTVSILEKWNDTEYV